MRSVLTEPKDALEARAERKVTDIRRSNDRLVWERCDS